MLSSHIPSYRNRASRTRHRGIRHHPATAGVLNQRGIVNILFWWSPCKLWDVSECQEYSNINEQNKLVVLGVNTVERHPIYRTILAMEVISMGLYFYTTCTY